MFVHHVVVGTVGDYEVLVSPVEYGCELVLVDFVNVKVWSKVFFLRKLDQSVAKSSRKYWSTSQPGCPSWDQYYNFLPLLKVYFNDSTRNVIAWC